MPHPDAQGDGLILLGGGPWGTAGTRNVPTLKEEINLAVTCLMQDIPVIGIGLGAQILALAAGGRSESSPFEFKIGRARRTVETALNGFLPAEYPLVTYMRDRPVPPDYAQILAVDDEGLPALFQIGGNAFGLTGHPGIKRAMVEDLLMEFEEGPENSAASLESWPSIQTEIEDSLVSIMTGLVQMTALMV